MCVQKNRGKSIGTQYNISFNDTPASPKPRNWEKLQAADSKG